MSLLGARIGGGQFNYLSIYFLPSKRLLFKRSLHFSCAARLLVSSSYELCVKHYMLMCFWWRVIYSYSSFVNWELWWPNFPVLVYFKETQTKPEGQIHFFPVIFVRISQQLL